MDGMVSLPILFPVFRGLLISLQGERPTSPPLTDAVTSSHRTRALSGPDATFFLFCLIAAYGHDQCNSGSSGANKGQLHGHANQQTVFGVIRVYRILGPEYSSLVSHLPLPALL
jgi:hypothetical protein